MLEEMSSASALGVEYMVITNRFWCLRQAINRNPLETVLPPQGTDKRKLSARVRCLEVEVDGRNCSPLCCL